MNTSNNTVASVVWSLTDTQETILRTLLSGTSYGAKIADVICESSDYNVILDLGYVYKMLRQLQVMQLIEVASVQDGGRERNFHRQKHYCITELGRSTLERKDIFRRSLARQSTNEGEQEIAVT